MAKTFEELSVKFTADIADLTKKLDTIEAKLVKTGAAVEKQSAKMGKAFASFSRLLSVGAIIGAARAIGQFSTQLEQQADDLQDLAQRANIGVESLQRLQTVAKENGSSAETMSIALVRLQKSMGEARSGAKATQDVFAALGLERLVEQNVSTEDAFYALADAMQNVTDASTRSKVLTDLLGNSGDELAGILGNGATVIHGYADAVASSSVVSEEMNTKLADANEKSQRFYAGLKEFWTFLDGNFIDVLQSMGDFLDGLVARWDSFSKAVGNAGSVLGEFYGGQSARPPALPAAAAPSGKFTDVQLTQASSDGPQFVMPSGVAPSSGPLYTGVNYKALRNLYNGGGAGAGGGSSKKFDDAAAAAKRYQDTVDELNFQIAQLGRSEEAAAFQEALRNNLQSAGVALNTKEGQTIATQTMVIQENTKAKEAAAEAEMKLQELHDRWQQIGNQIEDGLAGAFTDMATGAGTAKEAIAGLLDSMGQLIAKQLFLQAIQGITQSAFGEGGIGAFLSGAFAGGKAMGGGVNPGNAYQVGESGPEVFVPKVPGTIVPNRSVGGGGGGLTYAPTINANGGNMEEIRRMLDQDKKELIRIMPRLMIDKKRRNALGGAFK